MKPASFVILILVSATIATAQTEKQTFSTPEEARDLSKRATELFFQGEIDAAVDLVTPYWPIPDQDIDAFRQQTKQSMPVVAQRYGTPFKYLKIKEQSIDFVAFKEVYLIQYEITSIRVIFTYYEGPNGLILNGFKWDDNMSLEFE